MLLKILGILWIVLGIYSFHRPKALLKILQKKSIKKLRKLLFALWIIVSSYFISIGLEYSSFLAKIVLIIGIGGIIESFIILNKKLTDDLLKYSLEISDNVLKVVALLYILIGFVFLYIK